MTPRRSLRRPPLALAAAALASTYGALYSIALWVQLFVNRPVHEDLRLTYVAAEAGLRYGWSAIYDQATLRALSAGFPPDARSIDSLLTFVNPPLLAWLFTPLTVFPEPVAYAAWALVSLAALALAWRAAAPYGGLARMTLLTLALALWPVFLTFYFGQPTLLVLALVVGAWWLAGHDRPVAAGAALAAATFLKPQDVAFVPVVLLMSGRFRLVGGWAAGCAALGAATAVSLGASGLASWWHVLEQGQGSATHTEYTLAHFFGFGPLTYALWAAQGVAALAVAWWRRAELETVFTVGILATAALGFHFHELDYTMLLPAAWLFLRSSPPVWQRLWLLVGIVTMQAMTYGPGSSQPAWDVATHAPQLVWDAGWLAILFAGSVAGLRRATNEAESGVSMAILTPSKPRPDHALK